MSTDRLGAALLDLVKEVGEGSAPPFSAALWARARRRRRFARVVPALAIAVVVALVALVVWPSAPLQASVPAVSLDSTGNTRLTAFPDVIANPPLITQTATPGVTAAIIPGYDYLAPVHAVSPAGVVTLVPLPRDASGLLATPSVSPNGRWVSRGPVLIDLVTRTVVPDLPEQSRLGYAWTRPTQPSWWAPDSRRVFVASVNQGRLARFAGLVVATDGSISRVPLAAPTGAVLHAGWLDNHTLLALTEQGPGATRLEIRTWTVGDDHWADTGTAITWPGDGTAHQRAELSPDGARLLLTRSTEDPDTHLRTGTQAMMFDPRTGAQVDVPNGEGTMSPTQGAAGTYTTWEGWGCRPAWRTGLPVSTDNGRIALAGSATGDDLVSVSSSYSQPCVALAGNDLRGAPTTNHLALWQERVSNWGPPAIALVLIGWALWAWRRRHENSWRERPGWLPAFVTRPY